jgi:hypothetical protein
VVARQLPRTFTEVLAISILLPVPRIMQISHAGSPKLAAVPRRITIYVRGTLAMPLLTEAPDFLMFSEPDKAELL